jgi:formate-dependent nitrite reductase membrane component NrfD
MDIVDLTYQKDIAHWTWTIAAFLWFVGIAGMGSVAYFFTRNKALGLTILPAMVIGLLFVVSHLTRWWNLPIALFTAVTEFTFNFQSWMFWGFLILSVHLVFAVVVAAANLDFLRRSVIGGILEGLEGNKLFLAIFAFMGFIATAYSGFLISAAAGIPLWNTALIPVLWVISGGVATVALLELYHVFGWTDARVAHTGLRIGLGLDVMKLLAILAFLYIAATVSTIGAQYGAQLMISGDLAMMTWVGIIGIGIIVPIVLGLYSLMFSERKPVLALSAVAALVGVLMLRATILMAGVWEPLVV